MTYRRILILVLVTLLVASLTEMSFAQQGRGSGRIHGTVKDTSGKPLKDVKITAEHLQFGTKFESKSDKKGKWAIAGLGTGVYRITAEMKGYGPVYQEMKVSQFSRQNDPLALTMQKTQVQELGMTGIEDGSALALFEEGIRLFEQEQFADAAAKFKDFLENNRTIYQVNINIALCYKEMGEHDKAITFFNTMLEAVQAEKGSLAGDEGAARALTGIGETYIMKGDLEKAVSYLQQAIAIFPQDEILAFNIGEIFFKQGETAKGIEYFNKAIEIKSDWPPPYCQRGYAYLNQANYILAVESFKKFVELAPDDPLAPTIQNLIPQLEEMIKK